MTILGLIPARSGSKGVPGKNLRELEGRSLIAWAAETGRQSRCTRLVLSTDSAEYADEGRRVGLEVPELRPPEIAGDDTPMMNVVQHMVAVCERDGTRFDRIVLLQPTSPFRRGRDVDACLDLLDEGAQSAVSVVPVPGHHNAWHQLVERDGRLEFVVNRGYAVTRRQDMPACWIRNGAVYALRRELLDRDPPTFFGEDCRKYEMPLEDAVNIDDLEDFSDAQKRARTWSP